MTKMVWSERHQRLIATGKQNSEHDALPLPHGKKPADTSNGDLLRILTAAGVPGVDPSKGRSDMLSAYAAHLESTASKPVTPLRSFGSSWLRTA
jgi:hypothetical protein